MPVYIKKDCDLLIVPNKCGSKYVEQICKDHVLPNDQVRLFMPDILSGRIKVTAVKRDPVIWYWSGYFHAIKHQGMLRTEKWTPKKHWRLALKRKLGLHTEDVCLAPKIDLRFDDFDMHCWIDPWSQVYQTQYDYWQVLPLPLDVPVHWVDLNSEEFINVMRIFRSKGQRMGSPLNVSAHKKYPPLVPQLEEMLLQLDDWSWRVGYDIQESIQQYRKRYG